MSTVFADSLYWIALINSRDQWHERAVSIKTALADTSLVTTDSVLTEVANFFAEYGEVMRRNVRAISAYAFERSIRSHQLRNQCLWERRRYSK